MSICAQPPAGQSNVHSPSAMQSDYYGVGVQKQACEAPHEKCAALPVTKLHSLRSENAIWDAPPPHAHARITHRACGPHRTCEPPCFKYLGSSPPVKILKTLRIA
eukprot:4984732-Pleurochrysis_carterae.AAC.2